MSAGDAGAAEEPSSQDAPSQFSEGLSTTMENSEPSILESPSEVPLENDGASDRTVSTPLKTSSVLDSASPSFGSQPCGFPTTFVRQKNGWTAEGQRRLRNSLLAGVGLLELGNAGDFAANVWNQVPVPHFAMALSMLPSRLSPHLETGLFKD